jgi:hypothetical protein
LHSILDGARQVQFLNTLAEELVDIVPIPKNRLSPTGRRQVDTSVVLSRELWISVNIEQTKDQNFKSVASIIKDLNTMITKKDVTAIKIGSATQCLDDNVWASVIT